MNAINTSQTIALHDLLQSIDRGDQNAVARAGITATNASRLMNLHAQELLQLIKSNASFINFEVDNEVLDLLLQGIDSNRSEYETAHTLIEADAPLEMIRHFFPDIRRTQYGLHRRLSGLKTSPQGRTCSPDEELEIAIATAWFHEVKDQDNPTPDDYLKVHKASKAPIRQIWTMHKPRDYGV